MTKKKLFFLGIAVIMLSLICSSRVNAIDKSADEEEHEWFDPTAPAGIDPCCGGGQTVCYGN